MPVLAWMMVIFGASTDLGSAEHTSRFLIPFLCWLNPHITASGILDAQFFVRKAAHLTEYAILAILFMRGLRGHFAGVFVRQAALVLAVVGLYAAADEFHQTFVASRTASPRDVVIDCCGAALGLLIYRIFGAQRRSVVAAVGNE